MFTPFICGSFNQQEEEALETWSSPCSPPKRSRSGLCRNKDSKNPYADRGLDKFSALLADLEDKKKKIYTQKGSQNIVFVRFVYSNSNRIKPIIVKKDKKKDKIDTENVKKEKSTAIPIESSTPLPTTESDLKPKTWRMKLENWKQPSCYLPVIMILILLFLAVFGRSFAILCTSLGWYLVPTIKGSGSNSKQPKKKKEYAKILSVNKIKSDGLSSPRSVITGSTTDQSPRQRDHRRSW